VIHWVDAQTVDPTCAVGDALFGPKFAPLKVITPPPEVALLTITALLITGVSYENCFLNDQEVEPAIVLVPSSVCTFTLT
jgi:hypothetical protein